MIDKFLKTAGVNNMEDFYKLHPTEDHFFKTYPHMKEKTKKKIRRPKAAMGGYYQNGGSAQEGSQEMLQKIMQLAAQAFQQGASPEQVLKALVKQGIPQDTAMQILHAVVRQTEDSNESQYGGKGEGMQYQEGMEEGTQEQEYARGGGIHINPAKKGTFTAQATRMGMGVQEAARHILAHKDRYSPAMVKKANFARNASKWKHEYGGHTMPTYGYGTGEAGVNPLPVNPMVPSAQERNQMLMDRFNTINQTRPMEMIKPSEMPFDPRMNQMFDPRANQMFDPRQQPLPLKREMLPYVDPVTGKPMSPTFRRGGYYQEGGETMGQEQMEGAPEQMQEQAMGQEQQPQQGGGQDQMMQQLAQMVAQACTNVSTTRSSSRCSYTSSTNGNATNARRCSTRWPW
jgi:hypothetical protein